MLALLTEMEIQEAREIYFSFRRFKDLFLWAVFPSTTYQLH